MHFNAFASSSSGHTSEMASLIAQIIQNPVVT